MKPLLLAFMLATTLPVQAQQLNMPRTVRLHNNATGEHLGTVTVSGNTVYIRDKDGKHVLTVVQNPDGSKTTYDPHGNVVIPPKLSE